MAPQRPTNSAYFQAGPINRRSLSRPLGRPRRGTRAPDFTQVPHSSTRHRPASVGNTLRVVRVSSTTRTCSSSRRTAWLTAGRVSRRHWLCDTHPQADPRRALGAYKQSSRCAPKSLCLHLGCGHPPRPPPTRPPPDRRPSRGLPGHRHQRDLTGRRGGGAIRHHLLPAPLSMLLSSLRLQL